MRLSNLKEMRGEVKYRQKFEVVQSTSNSIVLLVEKSCNVVDLADQ